MADPDQTTPNPNLESNSNPEPNQEQTLSKRAQRKLRKKQYMQDKKIAKKAAEKDKKAADKSRRRREWDEKLASLTSEEEKIKLIESKREANKERVERQAEQRRIKIERLRKAVDGGVKVVVDLEFEDLMTATEISSLSQQIMYCYAANGRSPNPIHLHLTGCNNSINTQLNKIPGIDNWIITKTPESYIELFKDQKENIVYLTADSENVLEELDFKSVYVIGGLVDRNRHKGLTLDKADKQGVKTGKLPIGNYLKMSSSQVLTVNQVVEIMLNYIETKDWKTSFFKVIPQRKRGDENNASEINELIQSEEIEDLKGEIRKKQCIREDENGEKLSFEILKDDIETKEKIEINENGTQEDLL